MKRGLIAFIITVLFAAAIGFGVYLAGRQGQGPEPPPAPRSASETAPPPSPTVVKVYRVAVENSEPRLRPTELEVPAGESPEETAVRKLVEQGDYADLTNPIPKGTRLLGLKIEGDLATVNLSREFKTRFAGGSEEEALAIGVIVRTAGQFPEIRRVRLLVEGKPIDSLGHFDLSEPLDVDSAGTGFNGGN